jgi:hypothetical protein
MRALTALGLVLLTACSSTSVGVDHDEHYDFSGVTTYAWTDGTPAANELNEKRIVDGVDAALAAEGLRKVESGADVLVFTEAASHQELRSSGGNVSVGVSRHVSRYGAVGVSTGTGNRVYEVTIGTLIIGLLDGETESLVWRASAEDTMSSDPAKNAEKIAEAIAKAFEGYPPQ